MLQFDSDALPRDVRFARYRELYADGTDAVELGPNFRACFSAWRLDWVTIFQRHLNDVGHIRGGQRAGVDGFDHFVLTVVVSGQVEIDTGYGFVPVPPGEAMVLDMLSPVRNRYHDAHVFTVRLGRERLRAMAGPEHQLHGAILQGASIALAADYLALLVARAERIPSGQLGFAVEALGLLIAGAFGPVAPASDTTGPMRDAARLTRIRALIDARLDDPDLGPDGIVALADVSRATLYRLFQPQGGLGAYIRARRLDRLYMALNDETDTRSFAQIALAQGFRSEAHASRLFQERYAIRPGQYRAAWMGQAQESAPLRAMRFLDDHID